MLETGGAGGFICWTWWWCITGGNWHLGGNASPSHTGTGGGGGVGGPSAGEDHLPSGERRTKAAQSGGFGGGRWRWM